MKWKTMDGCAAAAHVSYAFTEVAAIYPITPSSPMAETVDEWAANGRKNIFGQPVQVVEMQSEGGAAGMFHGSLQAGALTTTYTASQGLLLMIPNMYKVAGELLPGVFHVAARSLASHSLSIFGDHQDVMAARATGCAMLCEEGVQEVMDLSAVAHLAAIEGRVPFINFFDGFRTSHEIQKIQVLEYDDLAGLLDTESLAAFRARSLHPDRPVIRGTAQNPDIYFQNREASNTHYLALPAIVEKYMNKINAITGADYRLFNYYGAPDAERVVVAMGSVCDVAREAADILNAGGEKVGVVTVHLFRPFSLEHFLKELPTTVRTIGVLDRTKEAGALGEPLFLDVQAAVAASDRDIRVVGGRYGLSSKDVLPEDLLATFAHLAAERPRHNFTLGIVDDVTKLSLPRIPAPPVADGHIACKFWGFGSDGTVGANKSAIKIIGDHTDMYAQGYFAYDSKKSGGVTISHLRFGNVPLRRPYLIHDADFIACHRQAYVYEYDLLRGLKENGVFLLNCTWTPEELERELPALMKRKLAQKKARFYIMDAATLARRIGLGGRINMLMQAAFFALTKVIPVEDAVRYLKDAVVASYSNKGDAVVAMNHAAIDLGIQAPQEVTIPESWRHAVETEESMANRPRPEFVRQICDVMNRQAGDDLPVSAFRALPDGTFPCGTSQYEKRATATMVPEWIPENCIQCNQCSFVCPHATIRPVLATEEEAAAAPEGFIVREAMGAKGLKFRIVVSQEDCYGCGNCAQVCPAKQKALVMRPIEEEIDKQPLWDYAMSLPAKPNPMRKETVKGSQFEKPYFEFSGACSGCGETPYVKLVTQLFGDRMLIANATGCSSIYSASAPSMPYTTNAAGQGPAWANSLFEDNAEYGLGMFVGNRTLRERLAAKVAALLPELGGDLAAALTEWYDRRDEGAGTRDRANCVLALLQASDDERLAELHEYREYFLKPSQWIIGGDGWAYDIGYGGLDHVLAAGNDVNVLVLDTEVYSNTGGQSSKSTPAAAVAKFAAGGKNTRKKDLGMMAMSYGYVYVAQIAMGADKNQALRAIAEAEAYPGPSLIIAYSPCISHGLQGGMGLSQEEARRAVECGYWCNYRYNPALIEQGKNPFSLDSREPKAPFRDFLMGEVRFSSLRKLFPERAEELFAKTERDAKIRRQSYIRLRECWEANIAEAKSQAAAAEEQADTQPTA
ncbi:MAG: pyruvate:ferredoxin (flavodoxin) oxidoreductase [Veillonellaceae bacterium]|nr:pyruvate:ferredoxin (flavodoxin) oxidoreductase [Veillonellaceae bacterium]